MHWTGNESTELERHQFVDDEFGMFARPLPGSSGGEILVQQMDVAVAAHAEYLLHLHGVLSNTESTLAIVVEQPGVCLYMNMSICS